MNIGFAFSGSFCTYSDVFPVLKTVSEANNVIPIFSFAAGETDSRFGTAESFLLKAEKICGNKPITTIAQAEPIGPKKLLDLLIIAPCTGNTLAKLSHSIADTPITMAAKSHLRNDRPIVIAISTNDALEGAAENIGRLLARKNYYFVPFGQDAPGSKPNSIVADFSRIPATMDCALQKKQIQPILISR